MVYLQSECVCIAEIRSSDWQPHRWNFLCVAENEAVMKADLDKHRKTPLKWFNNHDRQTAIEYTDFKGVKGYIRLHMVRMEIAPPTPFQEAAMQFLEQG